MNYMAIDPGASGAVAWQYSGEDAMVENISETPQNLHDDISAIRADVRACPPYRWLAIIEKVHSMPEQGVVSTFKFGRAVGRLEQALACHSIPYEEVTPHAWQKHFGLLPKDKPERKREIRRRMQARYPHLTVTLKNADALAMLTYLIAREGK